MTLFLTKIRGGITTIERHMAHSNRELKKPEHINYRYKKDQIMHRLGDLLIQYSIEKCFELKPNQWNYHILTNGKVEIQSDESIYVSLSYSYPYIVCAIDNQPIGVDVEEIQDINYLELAHQFSENEFYQVKELNDFYEIWTKKESYTKMIGEGIAKGLYYYDVTQPLFFRNQRVIFQQQIIYHLLIQVCSFNQQKHQFVEITLRQLI